MTLTIGFLGGGNMASALLGGLVRKMDGAHLHVTDHNAPKLERLAALGVTTHAGTGEWISLCDLFVLAVKPQVMKEALVPVRPLLKKGGAALSIAAGIEGSVLSDWLGGYPVIRAMPNTPALVGAGLSGLWVPEGTSPEHAEAAEFVMRAVGNVVACETEEKLDVVGAVPGSGPAYVFRFLEALERAAQKRGFSPEDARELAIGTVFGAAKLARESDESFATLRERVTSKGGTTARALAVMNERDIDGMMDDAVEAALRRTAEMKALFR